MKAITPVRQRMDSSTSTQYPSTTSTTSNTTTSDTTSTSNGLSLHRLCRRTEDQAHRADLEDPEAHHHHHQQQQQEEEEEEDRDRDQARRADLEDLSDMRHCYSRLKRLVPTIPRGRRVSRVEILQHVIDYILDLQLALETHPALGGGGGGGKQPQPPQHPQQHPQLHPQYPQHQYQQPPAASINPSRTPLTVLNMDRQQRTSIVKKPEDSILCR